MYAVNNTTHILVNSEGWNLPRPPREIHLWEPPVASPKINTTDCRIIHRKNNNVIGRIRMIGSFLI